MNSESELEPNQAITLVNLPTEFSISLHEEGHNGFSYLLMLIGVPLICVGGLLIIFGPDKIIYNLYEGMSFTQILQAYPGLIASVGIFLTALGGHLISANEKKELDIIHEKIYARIDIQNDDIPEGYALNMNQVEKGKYRIELINIKEAEEARKAKEKEDEVDVYTN
jgi:hypothetical protein